MQKSYNSSTTIMDSSIRSLTTLETIIHQTLITMVAFEQYGTKERLLFQRRPECTGNSSSDENRSSGHASMSDTGGHTSSSSPPHRHHRAHSPQQLNSVPEDDRLSASVTQRNGRSRSGQNRNRHRATPAKVSSSELLFSQNLIS